MAIAQDKNEFIERWQDWADEFQGLMNSTESLATLTKIRKQILEIKKVINEVAEECYFQKSKGKEKIRLDWDTFIETGEKVPHKPE